MAQLVKRSLPKARESNHWQTFIYNICFCFEKTVLKKRKKGKKRPGIGHLKNNFDSSLKNDFCSKSHFSNFGLGEKNIHFAFILSHLEAFKDDRRRNQSYKIDNKAFCCPSFSMVFGLIYSIYL